MSERRCLLTMLLANSMELQYIVFRMPIGPWLGIE